MTITQPYITFHDGRRTPQLGFGTWQISNADVPGSIHAALEAGYRSIDTAHIYKNEASVGKSIAQSGIPREELFVATKVWNTSHGHESTKAALQESLDRLQMDYVDLYLIHWPVPQEKRYVETWEAMIQLRDEGRAKSIGVCNFNIPHLQTLLDKTGMIPVVNQIELHPYFQQDALRAYHADHEIITEAWSPLGQGTLMDDPALSMIAHKHQVSVARIVLAWHIQIGNMVLPKSITPSRIAENINVFNLHLDDADMAQITALNREDGRIGGDPDTFHLMTD
ncbi:MAG: aldo/keto reductase [Alcaligenaceae bacterium]|nr:aldo/keto reductase [Alcaligenaceae bacterium]